MEFVRPVPLHFFKPLLPGYLCEFLIPDAFFQHHFDGRQSKRVILRTVSGKPWPVTLIGRRLADGWPEFASAHDLQVGDFLVFALHGDNLDVKVFERSACEKLYPPVNVEEFDSMDGGESPDDDYIAGSDDEKLSWKSSEDSLSSFEGTVTSVNALYIPKSFAEVNDLDKVSRKMTIIAGGGKSWPVKISCRKDGKTFIRGGWHRFCQSNSLKVGDSFTFEMIDDGRHPVASIIIGKTVDIEKSPAKLVSELEDDSAPIGNYLIVKKCLKAMAHESKDALEPRKKAEEILPSFNGIFYSPTALYIPKSFAEVNGLNNRHCKMTLTTGGDKSWNVNIVHGTNGETLIRSGWPRFCSSNSLKFGDRFTFELVKNGARPVARIISTKSGLEESVRDTRDASIPNETPPSFMGVVASRLALYIPKLFALENSLNRLCRIILTGKRGMSCPAQLVPKKCGHVFVRRGWSRFCTANLLNIGDAFKFELVKNGNCPTINILTAVSNSKDHSHLVLGYTLKRVVTPNVNIECYMATIYPHNIKCSKLYLSKRFSEVHDLNNKLCPMVLRNTEDHSWPAFLCYQRSNHQVYIGQGWDKFRDANGFKAGDTVKIELITKKPKLVLRIDRLLWSGKVTESESSGSKQIPPECCLVVASNPRRKGSTLRFPVNFTIENQLSEYIGKDVILRNEKGSWPGMVGATKHSVQIGVGWRKFAIANDVKPRDILMLELEREDGDLCVNIRADLSRAEIDEAVLQGAVPRGFHP